MIIIAENTFIENSVAIIIDTEPAEIKRNNFLRNSLSAVKWRTDNRIPMTIKENYFGSTDGPVFDNT